MTATKRLASGCWRAVVLAGLVWTLGFGGAAHAQDKVTLKGEVLDLTCYLSHGAKGGEHRACAQMCAKKGLPIGLMTDSAEVFLLIEDHDKPEAYNALKPLAGSRAEVVGKKFSKSGMNAIMVLESKGL